jgi:hypothetical protein
MKCAVMFGLLFARFIAHGQTRQEVTKTNCQSLLYYDRYEIGLVAHSRTALRMPKKDESKSLGRVFQMALPQSFLS